MDGKLASGLKQSKTLGVGVFRLIDKKRHKVEIEYSTQTRELVDPQKEQQ